MNYEFPIWRRYIGVFKIAGAFAFAFLTPSFAAAIYADVPLEDVIQSSDVAVIGRLTDISETAAWGKVNATGVIKVEEILFGNVQDNLRIPVRWTIHPGISGGNDFGRLTVRSIWMLPMEEGVGKPTWHGVLDPSKKADVEKELYIQVLARAERSRDKKNFPIRLVYRNTTSSTIEVPAVEVRKGRLVLPTGAMLTAKVSTPSSNWEYISVNPKPGKVEYTSSSPKLSIAPGVSKTVTFNFDEVFTDQFTNYCFQFSVPGYTKSNVVYESRVPAEDSSIVAENPLWLNLMILLMYSPSREIIGGLFMGMITLVYYFRSRSKQAGPRPV